MGQLGSQEVGTQIEADGAKSGGRNAKATGVHQYFGRDELRARLTEHLPDITREQSRPMDQRFTLILATARRNRYPAR